MSIDSLSPAQAAGSACVVCAVPLDVLPAVPSVPVGRAGGIQVFACAERCAAEAGHTQPALTPPDDGPCPRGCPTGECYCGDASMDHGEAYVRCPLCGTVMWDGGCYCQEVDDR
jgi:hypothetical protein